MDIKPRQWTHVLGFSLRTTDDKKAIRLALELDGLVGQRKEGEIEGVEWCTAEKFREKLIGTAK